MRYVEGEEARTYYLKATLEMEKQSGKVNA